MKKAFIPFLLLTLCLLLAASVATAQDRILKVPDPAEESAADEEELPALKKFDKYEDFIVKGYSISFTAGYFTGTTYLDNQLLGPKVYYPIQTGFQERTNDILRYFPDNDDGYGDVLPESTLLDEDQHFIYDAAQKEVEPGEAYNLRVGIYIADNFHLDLAGTYISARARTTMMHLYEYDDPSTYKREEVDYDDGFKVYKGGLALMYDAEPARFWGIEPRLGFGLGGIINRYTELEDKTALYVEGNFALNYNLFKTVDLTAMVDYATFAFDVDELGYSNMVHYTSFSLGMTWFIDVLPADIRAAHQADQR